MIPRLIKILIPYITVAYINEWYSLNMVELVNKKPLEDIGFEWIPHINPKICDLSIVSLCIYFFIRWIYHDVEKIINFVRMITWIYVIRLFCFSLTLVPYPTDNGCTGRNPDDPIIWNVFPYLWNHYSHSCYDLMFSGHAAHCTLILMFTLMYVKNKYEKLLILIGAILCNILVIGSRFHYTHDVIIAIAVSVLTFGAYFSTKECPFFNKKN